MANIIKQAAYKWIEKKMGNEATVLNVRAWDPPTMYQIDLHLPGVDMSKWKTIQRVKCKVDEFDWRDYTPATWNVAKRECTMYLETGHDGPGSRWVKKLRKGDVIVLMPAHATNLPDKAGKVLCIGDGSALGHFLGLKQLTNGKEYPLDVAVFFHENYQVPVGFLKENPEFEFLMDPKAEALTVLGQWMNSKNLSDYSSIYILGDILMVTGLRKKLKVVPDVKAKLFAVGFWE